MRTLKLGLEARLGREVTINMKVVPYLVEHAGTVLNYCKVGLDGLTGYERVKGNAYRGELAEFGAKVEYRIKPDRDKLEARWADGSRPVTSRQRAVKANLKAHPCLRRRRLALVVDQAHSDEQRTRRAAGHP